MTTINEIASVLSFCIEVPNKEGCVDVELIPPLSHLVDAICDIKDYAFKELNGAIESAQCHLVYKECVFQNIINISDEIGEIFPTSRFFGLSSSANDPVNRVLNENSEESLEALAKHLVSENAIFPNRYSQFLGSGYDLQDKVAGMILRNITSIPKPVIEEVSNFTQIGKNISLIGENINLAQIGEVLGKNGTSIDQVFIEPVFTTAHAVGLVTLAVLGVATGAIALTCYRKLQAKEIA